MQKRNKFDPERLVGLFLGSKIGSKHFATSEQEFQGSHLKYTKDCTNGGGTEEHDVHVWDVVWLSYDERRQTLDGRGFMKNIDTGKTSQAITSFHFFDKFNLFGFYHGQWS